MVNEWQRYLEMATGLTDVTKKRAESVVRSLVKQGELASDKAEKSVDELLQRSERNRKAIAQIVRSETERAVERFGFVRRKDFERLERKVAKLEGQGGAAKKASAKKASAKKASAKKASKKAAAAKSSAQKTAAKKTAETAGGGGAT